MIKLILKKVFLFTQKSMYKWIQTYFYHIISLPQYGKKYSRPKYSLGFRSDLLFSSIKLNQRNSE